MRNLVLSIIAQNENQALEVGAENLGACLKVMGYEHRLLDMFKPSGADELLSLLQEGRVLFAYGIAGVGSRLELTNGINLWTASRTPFVSLWFDHPSYNYRQHIVDSPFVIQAYHVRDHIEARHTCLPPSSSQSILLPWPLHIDTEAWSHPFGQRESKILYAKTGKDIRVLGDGWKRHSPQTQDMLWTLVNASLKNRDIDLSAAAMGLFPSPAEATANLDLLMGIIQEVDNYVRAWRSDHMARALMHFPAHIIGRGWDYLKSSESKAEFFGPVSFHAYTRKLLQYKMVANSNPLWRDGIHERAGHAICFGNILVTDRTVRSESYFAGLPNYLAFEWDDNLADVIATALKLAEDDTANYLPAAQAVLDERVPSKTSDYVTAIVQAALEVRKRMEPA